MKTSDYKCFYLENYLEIALHNKIFDELIVFDKNPSIIIDLDGKVKSTKITTGHIRNNRIEDEYELDKILSPGIKEYKNITKKLLKDHGMKSPIVRGILNYHDPKSMKWHKDFVSPEMAFDPLKRVITFYVVCKKDINASLMVSPDQNIPKVNNLGFIVNLKSNMMIVHNQNLGHEFKNFDSKDFSIFSMLWYDMEN